MSRLTIELSEQADIDMYELTQLMGVKTKTDVVRKALILLKYVVVEKKDGSRIFLENEAQNLRKEIVVL